MANNNQPLPGIEHVILLMFENRSFDNVLGALYPATEGGGGVPKGFSNPWPGSGSIAAWSAPVGSAAWIMPYPDPNELYANMSAQIYRLGPMQGFVADWLTASTAEHQITPADIMQYYQPDNVPVTAALARTYMASDRYFASGPVQTWPNRVFSLCGTPGYDPNSLYAYLNNTDYPSYPAIEGQLAYRSIFQQLDEAGQSWKVYYDDEEPISALIEYVYDNWWKFECGGNVWPLSYSDDWECPNTFYSDVAAGNLPTFTLLEPRYQMDSAGSYQAPTSNHPGSSSAFDDDAAPISISCGERLLAQVYNALVAQPALFAKTLLVVTYDEHGGLFDHVYPPLAPQPFDRSDLFGFIYDVYGVRVPTLFINPYVSNPGELFRPPAGIEYPFDHTSLLATLSAQWNLESSSSPPLSPRVPKVPTFRGLIDPTRQPIQPTTLPVPDCVWNAGAVRRRNGHPVQPQGVRTVLRAIRRSRRRGGH